MADRPFRLSFYVQHLLGIGHLARAFRIAEALVADGWDVEVLVGGELPPGFGTGRARIVPLPPVRADAGGLSRLVHPDGRPFDTAAQAERRDRLLAAVARHRPDVLLIEAFPFGRRQMRFELLPLLESVRTGPDRPLVAASVRAILQVNRRPERIAETLDAIDRFFDRVLVHGDAALTRLEESFPPTAGFADKMVYTGLVAPPRPMAPQGRFDVVVSVGGGAVGEALLRAALAARPLSRAAEAPWLVLTGPNLPDDVRATLIEAGDRSLTVERFVPDLAAVLAGARLSVSQAGYNTVADVLVAGCRAVLVPYAQDGETEQGVRAALLALRGDAVVVAEQALDAMTLARAIDAALAMPKPENRIDLDGARTTAAILRESVVRRG